MSLINKIKSLLPASKRQIYELKTNIQEIEKNNKDTNKLISQKFNNTDIQIEKKFQDTNKRIIDLRDRFINAELRELLVQEKDVLTQQNKILQELNSQISVVKKEMESFKKDTDLFKSNMTQMLEETLGYTRENNWGLVFNNTIQDSEWLQERTFSLGRWAIGYQCAYVLFRILDEVKPNKILELGLGQSTKILGQYANNNEGVQHFVVENNEDWIRFFQHNYELSSNSNILHCDWNFENYKNEKVRVFDGFKDKISGHKFNLIMIDAPFGGDMKGFSRIDVLRMLPDCLESTFVIMIDDVERIGERNTFNEMKDKLEMSNISFADGIYKGKKSVGLIVSVDLKFVLTM